VKSFDVWRDHPDVFFIGLDSGQCQVFAFARFHFFPCNEMGMYTHALLFELTTTTP